jgi:hypothetical protein
VLPIRTRTKRNVKPTAAVILRTDGEFASLTVIDAQEGDHDGHLEFFSALAKIRISFKIKDWQGFFIGTVKSDFNSLFYLINGF